MNEASEDEKQPIPMMFICKNGITRPLDCITKKY